MSASTADFNSEFLPGYHPSRVLAGLKSYIYRHKLITGLTAVFLLLALSIMLSARHNSALGILGAAAGASQSGNSSGGQAAPDDSNASAAGQSVSNSSSTNVELHSTSTNGSGSASLKVNGQSVPVSDPNNIHEHFSNGGSTVNVNVQNNSSTSENGM